MDLNIFRKYERIPLIINNFARGEKAGRAWQFVRQHAARFAIFATRSAEESESLARDLAAAGCPVVIGAGGDGTLNALMRGLLGSQTRLGILPTGTMNVFAREIGVSVESFQKALSVVNEGVSASIDVFLVNGNPFLQLAGLGFDAKVIQETTWEQKKLWGPLAYLVSAVKVLGESPPRMTVRLEGGEVARGACVLVGNGVLYGGQFEIFNRATNTDGLMDVVVFRESGYRLVLDSLAGLTQGGFHQLGHTVDYFQTSGMEVESDREVPLEVDGDFVGSGRKFEFSKSPEKLLVLTGGG